MKYLLVLQWPANSVEDYDRMIAIEENLLSALQSKVEVDGHDIGSGEMNIFLFAKDPRQAFQEVRKVLGSHESWATLRAGYRDDKSESCVPLWPPELKDFAVS